MPSGKRHMARVRPQIGPAMLRGAARSTHAKEEAKKFVPEATQATGAHASHGQQPTVQRPQNGFSGPS
eukprot:CAMPEP_0171084174 /NCGR_PEP_ID=MMETSP0766_2-20121228/18160_1 /TAXON_ID=439317 /ORGANISM="Gambierdiscus australes, Strain CAWD 149" /LENGTH=67 /DNA_ID=CAMNT_0011541661 /DNA_START=37 /DNA_END=241 /DNA_ORIENTATION=+